jgi:hypothetical protein
VPDVDLGDQQWPARGGDHRGDGKRPPGGDRVCAVEPAPATRDPPREADADHRDGGRGADRKAVGQKGRAGEHRLADEQPTTGEQRGERGAAAVRGGDPDAQDREDHRAPAQLVARLGGHGRQGDTAAGLRRQYRRRVDPGGETDRGGDASGGGRGA